MLYNLIELKGYKRLSLNKIETIKITPQNKFHWILGSNGSGKSSLVREITPLAANHAHYHKGGYKLMHLTDKGINYRLLSDFRGLKNTYSFIRIVNEVEEELNPGHTATVFNNLVFQIFGITKEIHEFSLGYKEFTRMSTPDRKQWMTRLSSVDYSFALNYFKRLTGVYRDRLGSIKTDHERLIDAKKHLVSPEQVTALESRVVDLKEQLHYLNSICPNPSIPYNQANQQFKDLQNKLLEARARQKKALQQSLHLMPLEAPETLTMREHQLNSRIELFQEQKQQIFDRLDGYRKQLDQHVLLHDTDQKTLEQTILLKNERIDVLKNIYGDDPSINPKQALEEFHSWMNELEIMVPELVPDLDEDLNEENYAVYCEKLHQCQRSLGQLDVQKAKLQKDLSDAKECAHNPSIVCPACDHQWVPGHSEALIRKLETFLLENAELYKKHKLVHDEVLEPVTKYIKFKKGMEYLNNLVWKYPNFKPFWQTIFFNKVHLFNPETIRDKAFHFRADLNEMLELQSLRQEVKELIHKLELLSNSSVQSVKVLQAENDRLESSLDRIFKELDQLSEERNYVVSKSKFAAYLDNLRIQTEKDKKLLDELFQVNFEHFQRGKLSDLMLTTNAELMQVEKQIRSVEVQKGQIEMLEGNLEKTKAQAKLLKAAVDALSPSSGLIAKGLTGFINHFVGLVNSVIEKGWSYSMKLIPVMPDENDQIELDYKFMVKVKDEEVPDIELCSSGQQEIINLAIRIVALAFMRLDDGTLFLDEFGARMDAAHKASAFDMVSKLLINSNFKQIFMISHFEGIHNRGLEADITVLCPANIQLPPGVMVNKVTEIT